MNTTVSNFSSESVTQSQSQIDGLAQQVSQAMAVASPQPYGDQSKRAQVHQELADIKNWCEEARYLVSPDGQALNKDKSPEECPVSPDGSPLTHTIAQLSQWRQSSRLPEGYAITLDGKTMNMAGKEPSLLVDGVMLPIAKYENNDGRFEALELATLDSDERLVSLMIDNESVHHDLKKIKAKLSSYLIAYSPATEGQLVNFIQRCARMDSIETISQMVQPGFVHEQTVYVTHEETLNRENAPAEPRRRYQLRKPIEELHSRGSHEEWVQHVATAVRHSLLMQFAILVMLTNVLLNLLQKATTIVHFHGPSSVGKTTLAQVAQSVVGRATDPSTDGGSAIRKWHNTLNALLSLLEGHHGMGLVLDELGSFIGKNFGALMYAMTNGQRKGRCDKAGAVIETQSTAALCVISTGELSSDDYLRKTGDSVNSGARIRMPNIEVRPEDASLPGETLAQTKARIDQIKAACGMYYGTALPALAQGLLNLPEVTSYVALQQLVQVRVNECAERLVPLVDGAAESPLIRRGLDFFAMTLATGLYSIELGVLPYTEEEIMAAVALAANRWVASLDEQPDDIARAIRHLQEQVVLKRHEFPDMGAPTTRRHLGVIRNKQLLVRVEWFNKLVPQFGSEVLARLEEQGCLIRTEKDRPMTRIKRRTASIYDGQYYAFDYDKIMGLEGDDTEPEAVQPPKTTKFTRRPTCSQGRVTASPESGMQGLTASVDKF
jgi:putative DNA primase/helicase